MFCPLTTVSWRCQIRIIRITFVWCWRCCSWWSEGSKETREEAKIIKKSICSLPSMLYCRFYFFIITQSTTDSTPSLILCLASKPFSRIKRMLSEMLGILAVFYVWLLIVPLISRSRSMITIFFHTLDSTLMSSTWAFRANRRNFLPFFLSHTKHTKWALSHPFCVFFLLLIYLASAATWTCIDKLRGQTRYANHF